MPLENCPNSKCKRSLRPEDDFAFCPDCRFPIRELEGKYRFEKKLGSGGFGSVYLAHHTGLDQKRAVKLLHSDLLKSEKDKEDFTRRFQREAQLIVKLSSHPNIVDVFDIGVDPYLGHYYVMEHIGGRSLKEVLGPKDPEKPHLQKPLERRLLAPVLRQICEAVEAAHGLNIVHRDLKPGNIMMMPYKGGYWVKLIDFGIAKVIEETADIDRMTRGIGSAEYMAPEQVKGKGVSPKTDIYALGTIAYQLLVGRTPFGHLGNQQSILFAQFSETPEPIVEGCPDLPSHQVRGAEREIMKALEKDPSQRHASATAFWEAIEPHLPGEQGAPLPLPEAKEEASEAWREDSAAVGATFSMAGQMESGLPMELPPNKAPYMALAVVLLILGVVGGVYMGTGSSKPPGEVRKNTTTRAPSAIQPRREPRLEPKNRRSPTVPTKKPNVGRSRDGIAPRRRSAGKKAKRRRRRRGKRPRCPLKSAEDCRRWLPCDRQFARLGRSNKKAKSLSSSCREILAKAAYLRVRRSFLRWKKSRINTKDPKRQKKQLSFVIRTWNGIMKKLDHVADFGRTSWLYCAANDLGQGSFLLAKIVQSMPLPAIRGLRWTSEAIQLYKQRLGLAYITPLRKRGRKTLSSLLEKARANNFNSPCVEQARATLRASKATRSAPRSGVFRKIQLKSAPIDVSVQILDGSRALPCAPANRTPCYFQVRSPKKRAVVVLILRYKSHTLRYRRQVTGTSRKTDVWVLKIPPNLR